MQVKSEAKYLRSSPRKIGRILDLIRGKSAAKSILQLKFMPHKGAELVLNVLKSAVANAIHNYKLNENDLVVSKCHVGPGSTFKRFKVQARGRINSIMKRTSHITIYVSEGGE